MAIRLIIPILGLEPRASIAHQAIDAGHKINYPDLGIGTERNAPEVNVDQGHKINYPDLGIGTGW